MAIFRARASPVAVRIGAAALVAALVAEAGVVLLRPGGDEVEPVPVDARRFFTEAQLERGRDFGTGQRALFLVGLGIQGAALAALVAGRPRFLRRRLERLGARPLRGGALAGAGISLGLALVALPVGAIAHERAVDYGLSTQEWAGWVSDRGKSAAIGALLAAAGATLLIGVQRRFPARWWLPAGGGVVAIAVALTWLAPVVLAPLFNRFEPLPEGQARRDVLELARRAGVDVGEVLRVDASRRSTGLNAFVDGLGPTKRVVLYDNLLDDADRATLRAVVAHELAHVEGRDIMRGLAFVALVAPFGMLTVRELGGAMASRTGAMPGTPAGLPAFALALGIVAFGVGLAGNQLSRDVERRADTFAAELTRDPQGLIRLHRRLAVRNISDPDPPRWASILRTHPTTVDRIGAALALESNSDEGP